MPPSSDGQVGWMWPELGVPQEEVSGLSLSLKAPSSSGPWEGWIQKGVPGRWAGDSCCCVFPRCRPPGEQQTSLVAGSRTPTSAC